MDLLLKAMIEDIWIVAPILLCSFLTLGVVINRLYYYNKNKRDVVLFIPKLQKELARNNLDSAQNLSVQLGGIVGEVSDSLYIPGFGVAGQPVCRCCNRYCVSVDCYGFRSWRCDCCGYFLQLFPVNR